MGRRHVQACPAGAAYTGFCDRDPTRAETLAHACGGAVQSVDQIMASDVQGVVVSTSHDARTKLIEAALAARKHVLVDPPLAATVPAAGRLAQAAAAAGVVCQVGFHFRYAPVVQAVRSLLDAPTFVHGHAFVAPWPGTGWQRHLVAGGGTMWWWGVHLLDLICELMRGAPLRVYAAGGAVTRGAPEVPDTALCTLHFSNNRAAALAVAEAGVPDVTSGLLLEVTDGTRRAALWDGLHAAGLRGFDAPALRRAWPTGGDAVANADGEVELHGTAESQDVNVLDGVTAQLAAFAQAVRTGVPDAHAAGAAAGVRATALARALLASVRTGEPRTFRLGI